MKNIKEITLPFKVPVNLVYDLIRKIAVQNALESPINEVGAEYHPEKDFESESDDWNFDEMAGWDWVETHAKLHHDISENFPSNVVDEIFSYSPDSMSLDVGSVCASSFPRKAIRAMLYAIDRQAKCDIYAMNKQADEMCDEYASMRIEGYKDAIKMVQNLGLFAANNNHNFHVSSDE